MFVFLAAALLAGGTPVPFAAKAATPDCPLASVEAVPLPASRAALRAGQPFTVVAFGSSSTEGSGASTPGHAYPARLEALLRAALPGQDVRDAGRDGPHPPGAGGAGLERADQRGHGGRRRDVTGELARRDRLGQEQDGGVRVLRGRPPPGVEEHVPGALDSSRPDGDGAVERRRSQSQGR